MGYKVVNGQVVRTGKPLRHTNAEQLRRLQRDKEVAQEWARRQRTGRAGSADPTLAAMMQGLAVLGGGLPPRWMKAAAFGARYGTVPATLDLSNLEALASAHESDDPRAAEQALFRQLRKGEYQGACNRSDCLALGATWYNRGSMKFYCAECAAMLSHANRNDEFCKDAPLCHEVTSAEEAATLHT